MTDLPGRPLPRVEVLDRTPDPAPDTGAAAPGWWQVRPVPATGATRGRSDEAELVAPPGERAAGPDTPAAPGSPVVEVSLDRSPPRAGWHGAVDDALGARRAGAALARRASGRRAPAFLRLDADGLTGAELAALVTGYVLAAHRQDSRAHDRLPTAPPLRVVGADGETADAVRDALVQARATVLARELAGSAPDLATPERLTGWMAERLAAAGMTTEVLDAAELARLGAGGILAVGGGSAHPPRMLVARRAGTGPRVLLVGKGITFDTGGISVKPAADMHLMRTDMAGSAAVVAAAEAYFAHPRGEADRRLDVTVVVPSAENLLSGSAYRPGDVVTHLGGITSEVTNTDAEGRMVLADALAHGIALCDPDVVVDAATLTGAAKVALGMRTGAVMGTSDALIDAVSAAGAAAGERWWRLPMPADLRDRLRSDVADVRQAPGGPGSITAGMFLARFVGERAWAHLDIAGPARSPEELDEVGPVATGFATRTILGLLRSLADGDVAG